MTNCKFRRTDPNVLDDLLLAVEPEPVVDPEFDELERRLGPERVLGGHVEVVHEGAHLLAADRHKHALRPLLHATLDDVLHVVRLRLYGGARQTNMNRTPSFYGHIMAWIHSGKRRAGR